MMMMMMNILKWSYHLSFKILLYHQSFNNMNIIISTTVVTGWTKILRITTTTPTTISISSTSTHVLTTNYYICQPRQQKPSQTKWMQLLLLLLLLLFGNVMDEAPLVLGYITTVGITTTNHFYIPPQQYHQQQQQQRPRHHQWIWDTKRQVGIVVPTLSLQTKLYKPIGIQKTERSFVVSSLWLSLSSSSLSSSDDNESEQQQEQEQQKVPSLVPTFTSEHIYIQRLQYQIQILRQKDRSSQPITVKDLKIIYEDDDLIVVDKPSGILCVPSEDGVPSIVETVFEHVQQRHRPIANASDLGAKSNVTGATTSLSNETIKIHTTSTSPTNRNNEIDVISLEQQEQQQQRVHTMDQMVVHRLGYDTAGLLILAKTLPAVRALNILFRTRPAILSQSNNVAAMKTTTTTTTTTVTTEIVTSTGTIVDTNAATTTTSDVDHDNENNYEVIQNSTVVYNDNSFEDIDITERLNHMGIIRQYEVLVAGHVNPQIKPKLVNTTTRTTDDVNNNNNNNNNKEGTTTKQPLGSGWIDLPLMRCYEYPPYMRVSTRAQQQYLLSFDSTIVGKQLLEAPKASVTYYEIINYEYYDNNTSLPVTRLTLTSMTGRTHQLNVHCAAIGHPIVLDTVYGYNGSAAAHGGLPIDELPIDHASVVLQHAIHEAALSSSSSSTTIITTDSSTQMCVHAKVIRFKHPITGVELEFTSTPSF